MKPSPRVEVDGEAIPSWSCRGGSESTGGLLKVFCRKQNRQSSNLKEEVVLKSVIVVPGFKMRQREFVNDRTEQ